MGPRILIVDDHLPTLDSTIAALAKEFQPIRVDPLHPEFTALQLWRESPGLKLALVDLLLVRDASPHHLHGAFSLIEAFKRRPGARVAVHSNYASHVELARALEVGSDAFINKTWKRDRFLSHVRLLGDLHRMEVLRAASPDLDVAAETGTPPRRTADICRGIVSHLPSASPDNLHLAALLLAAQLHDRGWLGRPAVLWPNVPLTPGERADFERHIARAHEIEALGGGYREVGRILSFHHLRFREPQQKDLPDYSPIPSSSDSTAIPRGEAIPLEARVLQVAEAFELLTTEVAAGSAFEPAQAVKRLEEETEQGAYDPQVVAALASSVSSRPEWLKKIFPAHP